MEANTGGSYNLQPHAVICRTKGATSYDASKEEEEPCLTAKRVPNHIDVIYGPPDSDCDMLQELLDELGGEDVDGATSDDSELEAVVGEEEKPEGGARSVWRMDT